MGLPVRSTKNAKAASAPITTSAAEEYVRADRSAAAMHATATGSAITATSPLFRCSPRAVRLTIRVGPPG